MARRWPSGRDGSVYFSDLVSGCVRKISPDGVISSFACGLGAPLGLAFDPSGNLYVSSVDANQVFRITPAGDVSVFAGTATPGYAGDGGPATAAQLDVPHGVTVAPNGDVLISDRDNCVIRSVSPDGTIRTYAGDSYANATGVGQGCAMGHITATAAPPPPPEHSWAIPKRSRKARAATYTSSTPETMPCVR